MALRRHVHLFVLLVAIENDVLVDPALVGSIKFGGTRTLHQWNSGGMEKVKVNVDLYSASS